MGAWRRVAASATRSPTAQCRDHWSYSVRGRLRNMAQPPTDRSATTVWLPQQSRRHPRTKGVKYAQSAFKRNEATRDQSSSQPNNGTSRDEREKRLKAGPRRRKNDLDDHSDAENYKPDPLHEPQEPHDPVVPPGRHSRT